MCLVEVNLTKVGSLKTISDNVNASQSKKGNDYLGSLQTHFWASYTRA